MRKIALITVIMAFGVFLFSCGNSGNKHEKTTTKAQDQTTASANEVTKKSDTTASQNPAYDPQRGQGKFDSYKPGLFNAALAAKGNTIYQAKCQSCHKLTNERLVGPGWKGVTKRHTAAWILNFVTNTDVMLEKDPYLKKKIEICMVRMPDQNLTDQEAKAIYQFMRKNDGNTK